jgi:hypothetical protein
LIRRVVLDAGKAQRSGMAAVDGQNLRGDGEVASSEISKCAREGCDADVFQHPRLGDGLNRGERHRGRRGREGCVGGGRSRQVNKRPANGCVSDDIAQIDKLIQLIVVHLVEHVVDLR